MAELVDALALGASYFGSGGSTPFKGTKGGVGWQSLAYRVGLENQCTFIGTEGSNPSPTAKLIMTIEMTKPIDKEQYAKIAQFWLHWLKQHPRSEDDDDFHKIIRESAKTYLDLYESWLDIYTYIVKTTYIPTNKKLH